MKAWNQHFLANNARPSPVFKANEPLTDEAYARWTEQFADEHTGTETPASGCSSKAAT